MDQGSNTRFAVITLVRAYWEALRDGAALPRRDRVDPRGLSSALDQVFIAERIAPGIARFRLAGMRINDLLGMEVRGMPLSALFEPAARLRLAPVIEQVFAAPAIAELGLEAERGIGRPAVAARMLLLPLTNSRGLSDLMLGCLAVEGEIGRSPRRFAISRVLQEPLTGLPGMGVTGSGALGLAKAAPRMRLAPGLTEQAGRGFAEQAGTFTPPRGKPHLRLVKSDD